MEVLFFVAAEDSADMFTERGDGNEAPKGFPRDFITCSINRSWR